MNRTTAAALAASLLAACGGAEELPLDASAPPVPFVDQLNPAGKTPSYDGTEFCGPALLAGIAKARAATEGLSDAALIERLAGIAGTDARADGTTGHGMIAGLEFLGLRTDAKQGADLDWIDAELVAGHDVIAGGDYYAIPGRQQPGLHAGHYIAVTAARGGWSSYDVTDPADGRVRSLTEDELHTFIVSHPEGGFTLAAW